MRYMMYDNDAFFELISCTLDMVDDHLKTVAEQLDYYGHYTVVEPARPKRKRTVKKKVAEVKKKVAEKPKEPELPEIEKSDAGKLADKFTELLTSKVSKPIKPRIPKVQTVIE